MIAKKYRSLFSFWLIDEQTMKLVERE